MMAKPLDSKSKKLQEDGFWNPKYEQPRTRSNTMSGCASLSSTGRGDASSDYRRPFPKPRRTMSVSGGRDNIPRPKPRSRLSASILDSTTSMAIPEIPEPAKIDCVYSTPLSSPSKKDGKVKARSTAPSGSQRPRKSSVSSSSSSASSTSSTPTSPVEALSPEQFWSKYKRSPELKKFRTLFSGMNLSASSIVDSAASPTSGGTEEPVYCEIYSPLPRPPLPRKNSVSKPPARPPYPPKGSPS